MVPYNKYKNTDTNREDIINETLNTTPRNLQTSEEVGDVG